MTRRDRGQGELSADGGVALDDRVSEERRTESPSTNTVFELLDNQRRRAVVHYLQQRRQPVTLRDLSRQVAAWENHEPLEEVTPTERHRVYNALQQQHLPKMDRAAVVEYDRDRGTIAPTPKLEDLQVYLEVVQGDDIPWSTYYLMLGLLGVVVTAAVVLDVVGGVPGVAVAAGLAVTLVASALVHSYRTRQMSLGGTGPPPELSP
jgi:Flp pilus assembly protein TadB